MACAALAPAACLAMTCNCSTSMMPMNSLDWRCAAPEMRASAPGRVDAPQACLRACSTQWNVPWTRWSSTSAARSASRADTVSRAGLACPGDLVPAHAAGAQRLPLVGAGAAGLRCWGGRRRGRRAAHGGLPVFYSRAITTTLSDPARYGLGLTRRARSRRSVHLAGRVRRRGRRARRHRGDRGRPTACSATWWITGRSSLRSTWPASWPGWPILLSAGRCDTAHARATVFLGSPCTRQGHPPPSCQRAGAPVPGCGWSSIWSSGFNRRPRPRRADGPADGAGRPSSSCCRSSSPWRWPTTRCRASVNGDAASSSASRWTS